ncbi:MAG: hypothetical protein PHV34_17580 [Verrucomicrobiae bacterium]|nr:hypothetical protein [Verrucomicrobiae bacterium]
MQPGQNAAPETKSLVTGGDTPPANQQPKSDPQGGQNKQPDPAEEPVLTGAPEKYSDFKFEEGFQAHQPMMEDFTGLARKLNLSQDGAQEVVDFGHKLVRQTLERKAAADVEAMAAKRTNWAKETKEHAEYGGINFEKNLQLAIKAREYISPKSPSLIDFLDKEGAGDNVNTFIILAEFGKLLGEAKFVKGQAGGQKDAASVFYDHPTSQTK